MSTNLTDVSWGGVAGKDHSGSHKKPDLTHPATIRRLEAFTPPESLVLFLKTLTAIGCAAFILGLLFAPVRAWGSVLIASVFFVGLGLGGIFFIAVQYTSGAGWSVVLRRIPESLVDLVIWGILGVVALLAFSPGFYEWYHNPDVLHGFKGWWLNYPFLLGRLAVYAVLWIGLGRLIVANSRAQDNTGGLVHHRRNVVLSPLFIVLFAVTVWLSSVDWLMSLEPHWYSTIYGVYCFSGFFTSALALIILLTAWLQTRGPLRGIVTENHLQDLGKLLLAFCTFWAYIWFSEYMLIWYADIPEETSHFIVRTNGTWGPLFMLNLVLNWIIPFFVLLPRAYKRSPSVMIKVAAVVLLGRWLDLYLLVYPSFAPDYPPLGVWEVGIAAGGVGICGLVVLRSLGKATLVPLKDPLLQESLQHHQ